MGGVGAVEAVGRAMGAVDVIRCNRSLRADWRGWMSSCIADSWATLEKRLWRLVQSA